MKPERLKQPASAFYGRLSKREAEITRAIVDDVPDFLKERSLQPFLVAGVGGILRYDNPNNARDIDLVVACFKYAPEGRHTFDDVINFTRIIRNYFTKLVTRTGNQWEDLSAELRKGSGPFAYADKASRVTQGKDTFEVRSELERFGHYGSKGLQICYQGIRPIDVQFSFNKTPAEWKLAQRTLKDFPGDDTEGKSPKFFYAVLHEVQ